MMGWQALFYKEVLRFWKVSAQTIAAPVLTALLYMLIFGHLLEGRVTVYDSVSYTAFLVPGLVMMSLLQNAFANSSSSMVQSKMMGNLVFILLTPLGPLSWFAAYVLAAVVRGLVVGLGVWWRKLGANGTNVNELTSQLLTDMGRAPVFYDCAVQVASLR